MLSPKKGSEDPASPVAWWQSLYDPTNCLEIQENAEDMTCMAYFVYAVSEAWGIFLIILGCVLYFL